MENNSLDLLKDGFSYKQTADTYFRLYLHNVISQKVFIESMHDLKRDYWLSK